MDKEDFGFLRIVASFKDSGLVTTRVWFVEVATRVYDKQKLGSKPCYDTMLKKRRKKQMKKKWKDWGETNTM